MDLYKHPILYDFLDSLFSLFRSNRARRFFLNSIRDCRILEVGVGTGKALKYLKRCNFVGIDPSIGMLKRAKCKKAVASAYNLPFKEKSFDIVLFIFTLCVIKDVRKAINEGSRVGKKVLVLEYGKPKHISDKRWDLAKKFGKKLYKSDLDNVNLEGYKKKELMDGLFRIYEISKK